PKRMGQQRAAGLGEGGRARRHRAPRPRRRRAREGHDFRDVDRAGEGDRADDGARRPGRRDSRRDRACRGARRRGPRHGLRAPGAQDRRRRGLAAARAGALTRGHACVRIQADAEAPNGAADRAMSWRAELRPRLSVRALSAVAGVALAVLTAALAGGVTWLALVLDHTTEVLSRDAHSLQLLTEAELNLFAYHQASNLRLVTDDPQAIADADAVREALQRDIRVAVAGARSYAGPNDELELVERAAMEIEAYFAARNDLEAGQLDFDIVWTESRAHMRPTVETLDALRRIN